MHRWGGYRRRGSLGFMGREPMAGGIRTPSPGLECEVHPGLGLGLGLAPHPPHPPPTPGPNGSAGLYTRRMHVNQTAPGEPLELSFSRGRHQVDCSALADTVGRHQRRGVRRATGWPGRFRPRGHVTTLA